MTDDSTQLSQNRMAVAQRKYRARKKEEGYRQAEMYLPTKNGVDARIRRILKLLMPDNDGKTGFLDTLEAILHITDTGAFAKVSHRKGLWKCVKWRPPFF